MRLLRVPGLLARVPRPPVHGRWAPGVPPADAPQRDVLPAARARDARGDRRGRLRTVPGPVLLALSDCGDPRGARRHGAALGRRLTRDAQALPFIFAASSRSGGSYASLNVGNGWTTSVSTSIEISARIASVASPIHSSAWGPIAEAPSRVRRLRSPTRT